MGCVHYRNEANEARRKIKLLNDDYRRFVQVKTRVSNCTSLIESSAGFFDNLGAALDKIVINQKKFDDGQCRQTATDIRSINDEIENVVTQIENGIEIIDQEKQRQQKIIDKEYFCNYCSEQLAKQNNRNTNIDMIK